MKWKKIIFALLLVSGAVFAAPDEELLGKSKGYLIGTAANWDFDETVRVGSLTNQDKIPHLYFGKSNEVQAGRGDAFTQSRHPSWH